MKRYTNFTFAFVLIIFFSTNVFSQTFEGTITMEVTSAQQKDLIITTIANMKGDKCMAEMQIPGIGNMEMFTDQKSGRIVTFHDSAGMEGNLRQAKDLNKNISAKVKATEEKKIINGHSCVCYQITMHNDSTDLSSLSPNWDLNWWMTDDLPKNMSSSMWTLYNTGGNTSPASAVIDELSKKGLVPIKVETLMNGKIAITTTFVKYEQKHIDDSVFVIPSYVKLQPNPIIGRDH